MRHSIRFFALAAALATGAACEKPSPAAQPADSPASLAAYDTLTERIDTLVTLGAWMSAHPHDEVGMEAPEGLKGENLCRVARSELPVGSRRLVRSAVFNLPEPAVGDSLPRDTTRVAERYCHLRAVWLEMPEPDSLRAGTLADSIAFVLGAKLGASSRGIRMAGFGTGLWTSAHSWSGHGTTVVLGVGRTEKEYDDSGRALPTRPREIVAAAYAPNSGLDRISFDPAEPDTAIVAAVQRASDRASRQLDSLLSWAALPALSQDLGRIADLYRRRGPGDTLQSAKIDSALLHAVRLVRDTAPSLEPARRAAALLAVDMMVDQTNGTMSNDSTGAGARLRSQLKQLGLEYDEDPLGGSERYTRPWLWEAYRADSTGATGHMIFMALLESGWTTKPNCQDGAAEYERVIAHGNAALERGDTDPLIHYHLGVANHDIVALSMASDAISTYVDRAQYAPLAPAARNRAIEHFRAFLATSPSEPMRSAAWRAAMALLVGRSLGVTYYCVYD